MHQATSVRIGPGAIFSRRVVSSVDEALGAIMYGVLYSSYRHLKTS